MAPRLAWLLGVVAAAALLAGVRAAVPTDNLDMHETHDWLNEFTDLEQLVHVVTTAPIYECPFH